MPYSVRSGVTGGVQFAEFLTGPTVTAEQAAIANQCLQRALPGAVTESEARALSGAEAGAATAIPSGSTGALPLPSQYPLMPGDAALWPSLSTAQQERALAYLQSGSTIRSSLLPD